jgi:hypothetical protein
VLRGGHDKPIFPDDLRIETLYDYGRVIGSCPAAAAAVFVVRLEGMIVTMYGSVRSADQQLAAQFLVLAFDKKRASGAGTKRTSFR